MRTLIYVLAAVFVLSTGSVAVAGPTAAGAWRDYYDTACQTLDDATFDCTLCHTGGVTSELNPYGADLDYAKNTDPGFVLWSATIAFVDPFDSDGDGVDNGVESATDCTFPGDASSVPIGDRTWSSVKTLFR